MNTTIKLALAATLAIFAQNVTAQETQEEREARERRELIEKTNEEDEKSKQDKIALLEQKREKIQIEGKIALKEKLLTLNAWKDKRGLTPEEVEEKKMEYAEEIALNMENQLDVIDNQIALVERTGYIDPYNGSKVEIGFGNEDEDGNRILGIAYKSNEPKSRVYDRRTYGELVLAFGLNHGVTENGDFGDDFSFGRSRFFELGYAWKTRVFQNSGLLQLKYGLSLQTNKLFSKEDLVLEIEDGVANYEEFPFDLKKSQLRFSNLVVPVHLEFGGWRKEQKEDYVRYRISGKFRMGIGGYVGVRLGTQQKLKYKIDGDRIKTKENQDFGGDNIVYGLSSYIRLSEDLSLYGKYDLSSAFETQDLGEVNNVSLGLRWDW